MANTEKPSRFDKAEYDTAYSKKNVSRVTLYLSRIYDNDIINHLKTKKSKSAYIKKLIRSDMEQ